MISFRSPNVRPAAYAVAALVGVLAFFVPGATPPVGGQGGTDVGGTIDTDTTWTLDGSPYRTTGDLIVAGDTVLTVEAGVEVELGARHGIDVQGSLLAVGTVDAPIRFTAASEGTPWETIRIAGGLTQLAWVELDGGGARRGPMIQIETSEATVADSMVRDSSGAGLDVLAGSSPVIRNTTFLRASVGSARPAAALRIRGAGSPILVGNVFQANPSYAMFVHPDASPRISALRFRGNGFNGALVEGTVRGDGYLPSLGTRNHAYYFDATLVQVESGASLGFGAGTTVRMGNGASIWVDGTLRVEGAPGREVLFTSMSDSNAAGQWRGIELRSGSVPYDPSDGSGSLVSHAILERGGATPVGALVLESGPFIEETTVRHSGHRGITVSGPDADPTLIGVRVEDNESDEGVGLFVRRGARPVVRMSSFLRNDTGVYVDVESDADLTGHNRFEANERFGVQSEERSACISAEGASWGAPSGPTDSSALEDGCGLGTWDGEGQLVSDGVDYLPFAGQLETPEISAPRCGVLRSATPTITGFAPPGASVVLFDGVREIASGLAGDSDGGPLAPFDIPLTDPLGPGPHVLRAIARSGEESSAPSAPLGVVVDPEQALDPSGILLEQDLQGTLYRQPYQSSAGCGVIDGAWQAWFHPGAPLTLNLPIACPAGETSVTVHYGNLETPAQPAEDGAWQATFELGEGGSLYTDVTCGGTTRSVALGAVNVAYDGFVYDAELGVDERIPGATVTLYRYDPSIDNYRPWDGASYYEQENPQVTQITGWYGFYPPPGDYRVVVEKDGYDRYVGPPERIVSEPVMSNVALQLAGPRIADRIYLPRATAP